MCLCVLLVPFLCRVSLPFTKKRWSWSSLSHTTESIARRVNVHLLSQWFFLCVCVCFLSFNKYYLRLFSFIFDCSDQIQTFRFFFKFVCFRLRKLRQETRTNTHLLHRKPSCRPSVCLGKRCTCYLVSLERLNYNLLTTSPSSPPSPAAFPSIGCDCFPPPSSQPPPTFPPFFYLFFVYLYDSRRASAKRRQTGPNESRNHGDHSNGVLPERRGQGAETNQPGDRAPTSQRQARCPPRA